MEEAVLDLATLSRLSIAVLPVETSSVEFETDARCLHPGRQHRHKIPQKIAHIRREHRTRAFEKDLRNTDTNNLEGNLAKVKEHNSAATHEMMYADGRGSA